MQLTSIPESKYYLIISSIQYVLFYLDMINPICAESKFSDNGKKY